jgi:hypothetical protein
MGTYRYSHDRTELAGILPHITLLRQIWLEFRLMTGANHARKDNFMLAYKEMHEVLSL